MLNFTDLTGLAGSASIIAASALRLPSVKRLHQPHLAMLLGAIFVYAMLPISGLSLAAYLRGGIGDVSITTFLLLCSVLVKPWWPCMEPGSKNRFALFGMIGLAALALYPMALGLGAYDPYRLGYGNATFVTTVLLITLTAWYWKIYWVALCLACATLAWAIGWYESTNLWDYLLDPFVSSYAFAVIALPGGKGLLKLRQSKLHSVALTSRARRA
ncbi:MAG: hypothetical protein HOO95_05250 [Gallionella sp.]|nr:hypothetical protein [Gallionella sp.]